MKINLDPPDKFNSLGMLVLVGIESTLAVLSTWSTYDWWENEQRAVGSIHPEDLGIPNVPTKEGLYVWTGIFQAYGPDMEGCYDGKYEGRWDPVDPKLVTMWIDGKSVWGDPNLTHPKP